MISTLTLQRGQKQVCPGCQTKFYDLRRPDPPCPRCGVTLEQSRRVVAEAAKKRKGKAATSKAPRASPVVLSQSQSESEESDEDEEDDADEKKADEEADDDGGEDDFEDDQP